VMAIRHDSHTATRPGIDPPYPPNPSFQSRSGASRPDFRSAAGPTTTERLLVRALEGQKEQSDHHSRRPASRPVFRGRGSLRALRVVCVGFEAAGSGPCSPRPSRCSVFAVESVLLVLVSSLPLALPDLFLREVGLH
jgi:hypothetical protein